VPGLSDGEAPLMLAPLGGGSVNEVFRVDSRLGRFVVRLNGPAWPDRGRPASVNWLCTARPRPPASRRRSSQ